jgi:hypothetical protein
MPVRRTHLDRGQRVRPPPQLAASFMLSMWSMSPIGLRRHARRAVCPLRANTCRREAGALQFRPFVRTDARQYSARTPTVDYVPRSAISDITTLIRGLDMKGRRTTHLHYAKLRDANRQHYSHSIVPGGLLVTSYTTRFTPFTSLMMRVAVSPKNFMSNW